MRYFLNTSAARPAVAGGRTFDFELVGCRGGSWLGILALDEPEASFLAGVNWPNTDEISEELYLLQKKKSSANSPMQPAWPRPSVQGPHLAVAERVGSLMSPAVSSAPAPNSHNSLSGLTAVTLLGTTRNAPPAEPLLGASVKRAFALK